MDGLMMDIQRWLPLFPEHAVTLHVTQKVAIRLTGGSLHGSADRNVYGRVARESSQ